MTADATQTAAPAESKFANAFKAGMAEVNAAANPKPAASVTPAVPVTPVDESPPEIKSEKGRKGWAEWKIEHDSVVKERDSFKLRASEIETEKIKEAERYRSEMAEIRRTTNPDDIKRLREEHADLHNRLKQTAIEKTPEWEAKYVRPLEGTIEAAKKLVDPSLAASLESLLRSPDSESKMEMLENLASDLSPVRQSQLASLTIRAAEIISQRDYEKSNLDSAMAANQQRAVEAQRQRQEADVQQRETLFSTALKDPTIANLPVFKKIEGQTELNQRIDGEIATAKRLLFGDNNDPAEIAKSAFWAVYGKNVAPLLTQAEAEIGRLQKQVESLTSVRPAASSAATGEKSDAKPTSFMDSIRQQMVDA